MLVDGAQRTPAPSSLQSLIHSTHIIEHVPSMVLNTDGTVVSKTDPCLHGAFIQQGR